MQPVEYAVTATLPDQDTAAEYLRWLREGHVQGVLDGGATDAAILHVLEPDGPIRIVTRYTFPSLEHYRAYEQRHAPALRADGLQRFGQGSGIAFERRLAGIEPIPAAGP